MFLSSFISYNKREFDFPTLKEYNDYLEQMEDIGEILLSINLFIYYYFFKIFFQSFYLCLCVCPVYNLTNNSDVEKTKQMMEQYQRENRDVIQRNKVKLVSVCVCSWSSGQFCFDKYLI